VIIGCGQFIFRNVVIIFLMGKRKSSNMKGFARTVACIFSIYVGCVDGKSASKAALVPSDIELSSGKLAAAGAVATAFGVTMMHPIDTIKTLQQSDAGMGMSMVSAGKKIMKDGGGFGALYTGLGPYVTSDAVAGGLKFASYEFLKKWVKDKVPEENYGAALFGCAAAAFMVSSIALVPGELLKQRLQMGQITSIRQGIPQIFKAEGILGFYQGYSGVCIRDVPYTMLELGIYDNLKSLYLKVKNRNAAPGENPPISQFDEIIAAALSGGITAYATSPFDTIKTKLMVDTGYTGFVDCFVKTLKNGGTSSLFNGSIARVAWLMPFTAMYLPIYDTLKRKMQIAAMNAPQSSLGVSGGYQKHGKNMTFGKRLETLKSKNARYGASLCF